MLEILLPAEIKGVLKEALTRAGRREVGGILMGEHVSEWCFRIVDLTVQHQGGGVAFFVRAIAGVRSALRRFFRRTNKQYKRYNYLGEWHSHPSFDLRPSATDVGSMIEIVGDPGVGANFAILLIARLDQRSNVEGCVTGFFPSQRVVTGRLIVEPTTVATAKTSSS